MATSPTNPTEVYILDFDVNRYAALLAVDEDDLDRFQPLDGTPMARNWQPVRMFWETEGGTRPISDVTDAASAPVFNARAVDALSDMLEGRGELLPLEVVDGGEYYAFNVTRLTDALDEERSELKRFKSDGSIMRVVRPEFDAEQLASETIFKLRQIPETYSYVTDVFRRRVEEAGLTGFIFDRRVWSRPVPASTTR